MFNWLEKMWIISKKFGNDKQKEDVINYILGENILFKDVLFVFGMITYIKRYIIRQNER